MRAERDDAASDIYIRLKQKAAAEVADEHGREADVAELPDLAGHLLADPRRDRLAVDHLAHGGGR